MQEACLAVKEFTEASGFMCPDKPQLMTKEEAIFTVEKIQSEGLELLATFHTNSTDNLVTAMACLINAKKPKKYYGGTDASQVALIAEQADAHADIIYYCLNSAAKKGYNIHKIFERVHAANMEKRFPDGTFHKDETGLVIKPPGWVEPDVECCIEDMIEKGSWRV